MNNEYNMSAKRILYDFCASWPKILGIELTPEEKNSIVIVLSSEDQYLREKHIKVFNSLSSQIYNIKSQKQEREVCQEPTAKLIESMEMSLMEPEMERSGINHHLTLKKTAAGKDVRRKTKRYAKVKNHQSSKRTMNGTGTKKGVKRGTVSPR